MKVILSIAAATIIAFMAACNPTTTPSAEQLIGPEWVVEDIDNKGIIDSSRITLNFDTEGRVAGRSGCNQYTGSYSLGEGLSIGQIAQTKMACPPALMDQEQKFTLLLNAIDSFTLDNKGALILETADGHSITARQQ